MALPYHLLTHDTLGCIYIYIYMEATSLFHFCLFPSSDWVQDLCFRLGMFCKKILGMPMCFSGYYFHNFGCTEELKILQVVIGAFWINIYATFASKWKTWSLSTWLCPCAMLLATVVTGIFCFTRADTEFTMWQNFHVNFTVTTVCALRNISILILL
jgi:hypothetical protein